MSELEVLRAENVRLREVLEKAWAAFLAADPQSWDGFPSEEVRYAVSATTITQREIDKIRLGEAALQQLPEAQEKWNKYEWALWEIAGYPQGHAQIDPEASPIKQAKNRIKALERVVEAARQIEYSNDITSLGKALLAYDQFVAGASGGP